jgi:hypothetical protein
VNEVFKDVYGALVDAQFAGFAAENTALRNLLEVPGTKEALQLMTGLQDLEHERDLPAAIAAAQ